MTCFVQKRPKRYLLIPNLIKQIVLVSNLMKQIVNKHLVGELLSLTPIPNMLLLLYTQAPIR